MNVYMRIIFLLREYFAQNTEDLFLSGGCYYLADLLHKEIPSSHIMINRWKEHCATQIESYGIYDITGKISPYQFSYATARDIAFMKKNYIPRFNTEVLSAYVRERLVS